MPRLNLKDEGLEAEGAPEEPKTPSPTPMLREVGSNGGKMSPIILILLILLVLAGAVYALNHFKVIQLWGKKAPVVTETLPEPELMAPQETSPAPAEGAPTSDTPAVPTESKKSAAPTETAARPAEKSKPVATIAPPGAGRYTVQFAAWMTRSKAEAEAQLLSRAGYDAFVDEATFGDDHWYLVRVGRYDSRSQAQEIVAKLQPMTEDVVWVPVLRNR
jgi:cell division septation protein DedD